MDLAKQSVHHFLKNKQRLPLPAEIPDPFKEKAGAFVTIRKGVDLRGCIGTVFPQTHSAAEEIIVNAISSATRDPRFSPVSLEELSQLSYSIDILGTPEPIDSIEKLDPVKYGVIVKAHGKLGLLLPDLQGVDTAETQVLIACQKGGISPTDKLELERFQVTRYGSK